MRGKKWTRLEKMLFLFPIAILAIFLLPSTPFWLRDRVFRADVLFREMDAWHILHARESDSPRNPCPSNLKQIALGLKQYTGDYDGKFPPVNFSGASFGWADNLQTYLRSEQIYHCPAAGGTVGAKPTSSGYIDYWYNGNLAGVSEKSLTSIANTILGGEGNDGVDVTNARYSKTKLPATWLSNPAKPPWRHLTYELWATGGGNFMFADGHVKRLAPEKISTAAPQPGSFTFAVR